MSSRNIVFVAAAVIALTLLSLWIVRTFGGLPHFSLITDAVAIIVFAFAVIRLAPADQLRLSSLASVLRGLSWRTLIIAAILVLAPFPWIYFVLPHVPNTILGTCVLFGPALISLICGVGLVLFYLLRWIWR